MPLELFLVFKYRYFNQKLTIETIQKSNYMKIKNSKHPQNHHIKTENNIITMNKLKPRCNFKEKMW